MTTKANAAPKRLRFGMAEPTSHAPANDKFSRHSSKPLTTVYFLITNLTFFCFFIDILKNPLVVSFFRVVVVLEGF